MTRRIISPLFATLAVLLAGCASASPTRQPVLVTANAPAPTEPAAQPPASASTLPAAPSSPDLARTDSQASVEFVVTPLNLSSPGETLDFDVSMNTHSVDLSWDLAALSVLTTDTGLEVKGLSWPVGSGHHYEGTLTFPAKTAEGSRGDIAQYGRPLLDGAQKVTLTIRDAGAAERVFIWELSQ